MTREARVPDHLAGETEEEAGRRQKIVVSAHRRPCAAHDFRRGAFGRCAYRDPMVRVRWFHDITRRTAVGLLGGAIPLATLERALGAPQPQQPDINSAGAFQSYAPVVDGIPDPEWYRDAKFGIWAHWGPQSAPEMGDWYARRMSLASKLAVSTTFRTLKT